ncbi:hypothetical protein GM708_09255, partial [Vibrio cholerae]|nr:hypothetical protein [Vibrio cholerae]
MFPEPLTSRRAGPDPATLPRWVVAIAVVGSLFVVVPLAAMVLRVDWPRFLPLVTSD